MKPPVSIKSKILELRKRHSLREVVAALTGIAIANTFR